MTRVVEKSKESSTKETSSKDYKRSILFIFLENNEKLTVEELCKKSYPQKKDCESGKKGYDNFYNYCNSLKEKGFLDSEFIKGKKKSTTRKYPYALYFLNPKMDIQTFIDFAKISSDSFDDKCRFLFSDYVQNFLNEKAVEIYWEIMGHYGFFPKEIILSNDLENENTSNKPKLEDYINKPIIDEVYDQEEENNNRPQRVIDIIKYSPSAFYAALVDDYHGLIEPTEFGSKEIIEYVDYPLPLGIFPRQERLIKIFEIKLLHDVYHYPSVYYTLIEKNMLERIFANTKLTLHLPNESNQKDIELSVYLDKNRKKILWFPSSILTE